MTLRERIAELENDLAEGRYGSTMHDAGSAREFVCENLKRHLDETAEADAERDRLARIGELVEGLAADRNFQLTSHAGYHSVSIDWDGEYIAAGDGTTLLDALEALKERCG